MIYPALLFADFLHTNTMSNTPIKRDWSSLADRFAQDSPVADPPAGGSSTQGGKDGLSKSMSGLMLGKSVCILPTPSASKLLCCASVGTSGNIFCFNETHKCNVESHSKQRSSKEGVDTFRAGIYVRKVSSTNPDSVQVYGAPIGDITLLQNHETAILACIEQKPSQWNSLFNDWARSSDQLEHESLRNLKAKARAQQTPAKRAVTTLSVDKFVSEEDDTFDIVFSDSVKEGFAGFGSILSSEFSTSLQLAFSNMQLYDTLLSLASRTSSTRAAMEQVVMELSMDRTWNEESIRAVAERLTDLELSRGDPMDDEAVGATVWGSIQSLGTRLSKAVQTSDNLAQQVRAHDDELHDTFSGLQNFITTADSKSKHFSNRLDQLESDNSGNHGLDYYEIMEKVESMSEEIVELKRERNEDRARIDSLETKSSNGLTSFQLGGTYTARDPGDVKSYLCSITAEDCDFGGFCDVYNVLIRVQSKIDGAGEVGDYLKRKKDAKSVELSENEAIVIYSFLDEAPPLFGGDKSEKSDIHSLPSYVKWRNKGKQSGLGYELQYKLKGVEREVKQLIQLSFKEFPELALLARSVLSSSLEFIHKLVEWVDSTYEVLVEGGNTSQDVWSLITKVSRALFEEGMAPHRTTPTGTKFTSRGQQSSVLLWGVLRTHLATETMLEGDLRDHPVVTGNYAKWLVNNSGKKDALVIKREVDKLSTKLARLEEEMATKRALTAVEKTAEAAKKVADKALAKAS